MKMYKLNYIQYPNVEDINISSQQALEALKNNDIVQDDIKKFKDKFAFKSINSFSFSQDGFLSLFLNLNGKILVSKGESQAIVDGALKYKDLGFDLDFIPLKKDGSVDFDEIKDCDYIFISSYVMDTFVKTDLKKVKQLTNGKIVSNISANLEYKDCDIALMDAYKLTGYGFSSLILHNEVLKEQYLANFDTVAFYEIKKAIDRFKPYVGLKDRFYNVLLEEFKDDIYFFVDPSKTLEYTLHFGLKKIKAREIIRTLALNDIFLTNGEGCSLGLSKPSRIVQEMGYEEIKSRWALSLSFFQEINEDEIKKIVKTISKKYRQIRVLND